MTNVLALAGKATKCFIWICCIDGNFKPLRVFKCESSLRAGSHFDISVSISINISIRKTCVNRDYISIKLHLQTNMILHHTRSCLRLYAQVQIRTPKWLSRDLRFWMYVRLRSPGRLAYNNNFLNRLLLAQVLRELTILLCCCPFNFIIASEICLGVVCSNKYRY